MFSLEVTLGRTGRVVPLFDAAEARDPLIVLSPWIFFRLRFAGVPQQSAAIRKAAITNVVQRGLPRRAVDMRAVQCVMPAAGDGVGVCFTEELCFRAT